MTPALIVLSACALAGCGASTPDTTLIQADDPELGALARSVLPEVARRSGMDLHRPVRVSKRSRGDLEEYLRRKLDEELSESEAERRVAAYSLLGLAEPDLDLRSLLMSVYLEQVVGFYEPDSTALFLVDDQPPEVLEPILVHELVHAIQDQNRSLDSLTAPSRGNDAQVAAQAAIEGHATLVMMEWTLSKMSGRDVALDDLPDLGAMIGPALAGVEAQYPQLAQAPRVVQEGMLYPYLRGAEFVGTVWRETGGRPSPLGRYLPRSTEQVSEPARLLSEAPDQPVRLAFEGDPPALQDNLGQLELGILLEEWGGTPADRVLAIGWGGDQFALYGSGGVWSLRWVVTWDDEASRDAFVEWSTMAPGVPEAVRIEAMTLGGRPATQLLVGGPPEAPVEIRSGA